MLSLRVAEWHFYKIYDDGLDYQRNRILVHILRIPVSHHIWLWTFKVHYYPTRSQNSDVVRLWWLRYKLGLLCHHRQLLGQLFYGCVYARSYGGILVLNNYAFCYWVQYYPNQHRLLKKITNERF